MVHENPPDQAWKVNQAMVFRSVVTRKFQLVPLSKQRKSEKNKANSKFRKGTCWQK